MTQVQFNVLLYSILAVGLVIQVFVLYGVLVGISHVTRAVRESLEAPKRDERTAKLGRLAERARLRFEPEADPAKLRRLPFNLFKQPRGFRLPGLPPPNAVRNLSTWNSDGHEFRVFDFQYRAGKGRLWIQTVCLVTSPRLQLPRFTLRPELRIEEPLEKMLPLLAALATTQDIDFEQAPEFSRAYFLSSPDEAATRALFSDKLIDCIAKSGTGYTIEGYESNLLLYRSSAPLDEPGIARLVELAGQILRVLGR